MTKNIVKSPLVLNIFWHNDSDQLREYTEFLYSFFLRNKENPLDRYLGIPVKKHPFPPIIKELQLGNYNYSANIVLVDDNMILNSEWEKFINKLIDHCENSEKSKHHIIPISFHEDFIKFSSKLNNTSFIRYHEFTELKETVSLIELTQTICRILYYKAQSAKGLLEPQLTLFLSHAKKDGASLSEKLRNHIYSLPNLNSFFDAKDISSGSLFAKELEKYIEQSIFIAIHTDEYSSREWCRKEVLLAKKYNRPILIINLFKKGELRSFPYLGNVPNINLPLTTEKEDISKHFNLVILSALREALKIKFHNLRIRSIAKALNKELKTVLTYPPELFSLTTIKDSSEKTILYPDPPLGQEEISLLNTLRPDVNFITPTLLPFLSNNGEHYNTLNELTVAFSLSESNHSKTAWIQNQSIQDLLVEVVRYLLVSGCQLVYSGSIKYEPKKDGFNFVELLLDLVRTYKISYDDTQVNKIVSVKNYSAYPYYTTLTKGDKLKVKDLINLVPVFPPENLGINTDVEIANDIFQCNTYDKRYVFAKSLTKMREQMIESSHAIIILGGKHLFFKGKMPGILEEVLVALDKQKPIFLIGAFGGVTSTIIEALKGSNPESLKQTYYKKNDDEYIHFLKRFNQEKLTLEDEKVEYAKIVNYLNNHGKLSKIFGLNNSLSKRENERLFYSNSEVEILSLILKGLNQISKSI